MNVDIRDCGRHTTNDNQSDIWVKVQAAISDGFQQIDLFACTQTVDEVTGEITTSANIVCIKTSE